MPKVAVDPAQIFPEPCEGCVAVGKQVSSRALKRMQDIPTVREDPWRLRLHIGSGPMRRPAYR